ncbi:MAG: glycosyltransferase family 39 protein [Cyanobacteria bacterium J06554_3]
MTTGLRYTRSLGWLLLGGLIFRGIIACGLPAGFDEAYYFLYTQNLDWSYFDHPPAVAWTAGLGIWLTGTVTPLTLRLGALSLFTGSLWLLFATGRWLFGARTGLIGCAIASLTPLFFFSFGILAAPDNALIFFWSAALYLCAQEFFPDKNTEHYQSDSKAYQPTPRLVFIALLVSLACLSKYHGFVLGLGLVGFCLTNVPFRLALRSRWMGVGVFVFAIALFPLLYWNAQHSWISFQFQLGSRFADYGDTDSGYSIGALVGACLAQFGYLCPSIALPLWWTSGKALFHRQLSHKSQGDKLTYQKLNFLLWSGLPVAVGFTLVAGSTHTFPAWPAPGLWSLTLVLAYAAAHWPHTAVKRWLIITGWTLGTALMIALSHLTFGTLQTGSNYAIFGGLVSIDADPSTELIDIVQLRHEFEKSADVMTLLNKTDFVITPEYWLSGYIAMAMPSSINRSLSSFTSDPRGHAFWFEPEDWVGKDAVLISIGSDRQSKVLEAMAPYFQSITLHSKIATLRGGETAKRFYLYQATNLQKPYPYPY